MPERRRRAVPFSRFSARGAVAALAGFGLAACATDGAQFTDEPTFQAGYGDGCVTATEDDKSFSTKRARDEFAFANDRAYAAGWRQGYIQCGRTRNANDGGRILGERDDL
jgi:hypothetical protein